MVCITNKLGNQSSKSGNPGNLVKVTYEAYTSSQTKILM